MTFNAMTEHYEEITVCGKPALFTSIRIKRDTVPDGLYTYDVRHDDECRGIPCEIAPYVMVNHWGTRSSILGAASFAAKKAALNSSRKLFS